MLEEYEFELCLTHDVDRPFKRLYHSLFYAACDRPVYHLKTALSKHNPYWMFGEIMELEADLDVRSAFYFLNEPDLLRESDPREWLRPDNWIEYLGQYSLTDDIVEIIQQLDTRGWEVGLHGSYRSHTDPERLAHEKGSLEEIVGHPIIGGRQHHLHLEIPETWEHHRSIGLKYDASLGMRMDYGFEYGYEPLRPLSDDEFMVFPLTLMDQALSSPSMDIDDRWAVCRRLLREADENDAVMTILWHPRYFNDDEFPGYCSLYRRIVERAKEMGAWIGPPGALHRLLQDRNLTFGRRGDDRRAISHPPG